MKKLFDKKGETYIDVAITVMIVAFVLVFAVNMVSIVALNQNMKTMADLTFTLYVGDTPGYRPIEVRINWSDRINETNTGNNSVSTSINVKDFDYEMSIDEVTTSHNYFAGERQRSRYHS